MPPHNGIDRQEPWAIVRYSPAGLPPARAVRLSRLVRGRGGTSRGVVAPPVVALAGGALLAPADVAWRISDEIERIGATHDTIPVWR